MKKGLVITTVFAAAAGLIAFIVRKITGKKEY